MLGHPRFERRERLDHFRDDDRDSFHVQNLPHRLAPGLVEERSVELGRGLTTKGMDQGVAIPIVGREIAHDVAIRELFPEPIPCRELFASHWWQRYPGVPRPSNHGTLAKQPFGSDFASEAATAPGYPTPAT